MFMLSLQVASKVSHSTHIQELDICSSQPPEVILAQTTSGEQWLPINPF